ncbi:hypothetical protein AR158_C151L [Paramecium bursaria Chlorella virus AR158]|uniref:hypothetical protein n=1 Tax=Paramecium bursaria Chlorella virus AR158 TaxID=380598 RepID=UPI00015AA80F|nr:hypothetical protein AR158_C151L [Paramecium bursaria Chlorella virus AR158]ABU43697.1 hypothetical protein AR158_C151L [Paramecium bursaria Chlorella virus AR158]
MLFGKASLITGCLCLYFSRIISTFPSCSRPSTIIQCSMFGSVEDCTLLIQASRNLPPVVGVITAILGIFIIRRWWLTRLYITPFSSRASSSTAPPVG